MKRILEMRERANSYIINGGCRRTNTIIKSEEKNIFKDAIIKINGIEINEDMISNIKQTVAKFGEPDAELIKGIVNKIGLSSIEKMFSLPEGILSEKMISIIYKIYNNEIEDKDALHILESEGILEIIPKIQENNDNKTIKEEISIDTTHVPENNMFNNQNIAHTDRWSQPINPSLINPIIIVGDDGTPFRKMPDGTLITDDEFQYKAGFNPSPNVISQITVPSAPNPYLEAVKQQQTAPVEKDVNQTPSKNKEEKKGGGKYTPPTSEKFDNSTILDKYSDLVPIYNSLALVDIDCKIDFIQSPGIFKFNPYGQNDALIESGVFFVDLYGRMIFTDKKIILPPENGKLEDGYMFSIDNLQLLNKVVLGEASIEELNSAELYGPEVKQLNKTVELAGIDPKYYTEILQMLLSTKFDEKIKEALKRDHNCRFMVKKSRPDNIILESNKNSKAHILDSKINPKRHNIRLTYKDDQIELS